MGVFGDIGSLTSAGSSIYFGQKNLEEQRKSRDLQKQMWRTTMRREDNAMQRRVLDLQAAGLSPTLAAGGSGASTASAPIPITPQRDDPHDAIIAAMSAAKNFEVSDSQIKLNQANILKSITEAAHTEAIIEKILPAEEKLKLTSAYAQAQNAQTEKYERELASKTGVSVRNPSMLGKTAKDASGIFGTSQGLLGQYEKGSANQNNDSFIRKLYKDQGKSDAEFERDKLRWQIERRKHKGGK